LLRPPAGLAAEYEDRMLVRDVRELDGSTERHAGVTLGTERHASVQLGVRAAVTDAPDGTRWVGLSEVPAAHDEHDASRVCEALLTWGAHRGATRGYVRVGDHDTQTIALAESLGFRLHHRSRYFPVRSGTWDRF
jgi:hypothetical protein